jgi:hypothetical protein
MMDDNEYRLAALKQKLHFAFSCIVALIVVLILLIAAVKTADAAPFVTDEPVDQKKNMGLYEDAEGPNPWGIPLVGQADIGGFAMCVKPGVKIAEDEHGNGIYAEDNEVIWRCFQTHPDGTVIPAEAAPILYCFVQNPDRTKRTRRIWACYHNYGHVWAHYQEQYDRNPLILPDELQYIPEVKNGIRQPPAVLPGKDRGPKITSGRVWSASRTVDPGIGWPRS